MGRGKRIFRSFRTCHERAESLHRIMGKSYMKKNNQRSRTGFLAKYGGLSIYNIDFENTYTIDDKGIHFVKGDKYDLFGNPDDPYGTSNDHKYFFIHDDLFDRILETLQELSTAPIPRTFDVTLHATKIRTLVQGSGYF